MSNEGVWTSCEAVVELREDDSCWEVLASVTVGGTVMASSSFVPFMIEISFFGDGVLSMIGY